MIYFSLPVHSIFWSLLKVAVNLMLVVSRSIVENDVITWRDLDLSVME